MTTLNNVLLEQFGRLADMLSPEHLTCDGELIQTEIDRKYRQLTKEWHYLEVLAGRKVSEEEIWKTGVEEIWKTWYPEVRK